jgi:hypothetical protein
MFRPLFDEPASLADKAFDRNQALRNRVYGQK